MGAPSRRAARRMSSGTGRRLATGPSEEQPPYPARHVHPQIDGKGCLGKQPIHSKIALASSSQAHPGSAMFSCRAARARLDVMLISFSRRDYATIQHVRRAHGQRPVSPMNPLPRGGRYGCPGRELGLFLGWGERVGGPADVAGAAGAPGCAPHTAVPARGAHAVWRRGGHAARGAPGTARLRRELAALFAARCCSVGHAVVAGLRARAAVTTNPRPALRAARGRAPAGVGRAAAAVTVGMCRGCCVP